MMGTVDVLQQKFCCQRLLAGGGASAQVVELEAALLDVLDEEVPLVLGRLAVLRSDDAGGPVQVEHVDQLLLLALQLLDLGLQVGVDRLQLLRLLRREEGHGGEFSVDSRLRSQQRNLRRTF